MIKKMLTRKRDTVELRPDTRNQKMPIGHAIGETGGCPWIGG
jgi:hypothetical protein